MPHPKANVLLVDDRPENLLALEAVLEGQNFNLVRALSGEEALKHLLEKDFAVILMDVQMPGLNGIETAELIKSRAKTRHIPIIFLTASVHGEEYVAEGYSVGAVDFILKPFEPDFLKSKVGVFVDLYIQNEQLKQQAQQLEQANIALAEADRLKDEFLSVVSHELRTPLNFIMGFASVLDDARGELSLEDQHAYLQRILNGADRMLLLVNDLLDFARMKAGRFSLDPHPVPFGSLVRDVASTMQVLAEDKNVAIETDVQVPGLPVVDGVRIVQVLSNLMSNAIKYSPKGGKVLTTARAQDHSLLVEVVDEGPGIAPEDQGRLFKKFQQLDMSSTRNAGGFGLGLAISKTIVEAHGGTIGVESRPGQGSRFWFALPFPTTASGA